MFKIKYFKNHLSHGFIALLSGRMIQFAANGLLVMFLPIFLLIKLNYNIEYVFLYYIIGYLSYALLLPIGAQFLNKIGLKLALRISIIFDIMVYICFFMVDKNPVLFLVLSLIAILFSRLLFWVPFNTDFAKFTNNEDRGKGVSLMWASRSFLSVVMPVIAGFLIVKFGFNLIFIITIIFYLLSSIPFSRLPRTKEKFSWGVLETFKKYFAKENRRLVFANMANGAENVVGIIIWPIFIWQLLDGDYLEVGILSALIVLFVVVLQLFIGKYTDLFNKRKMLRWGTAFYALGWFVKIFVLSAFQVFIIGAYHGFAKIFKDTPFDTLNYEIMADHGHLVDEYTVLKEMAIQFGRTLMLIFAIIVALNFGLNWTFALAAFASLFINLL